MVLQISIFSQNQLNSDGSRMSSSSVMHHHYYLQSDSSYQVHQSTEFQSSLYMYFNSFFSKIDNIKREQVIGQLIRQNSDGYILAKWPNSELLNLLTKKYMIIKRKDGYLSEGIIDIPTNISLNSLTFCLFVIL